MLLMISWQISHVWRIQNSLAVTLAEVKNVQSGAGGGGVKRGAERTGGAAAAPQMRAVTPLTISHPSIWICIIIICVISWL